MYSISISLLVLLGIILQTSHSFSLFTSAVKVKKNFLSKVSMVYFQRDDIGVLVNRADMIVGLPTEISITDLAAFKKQVWKCEDEVMGSASMTEAIDSTPFCMMAEHIRGKSHMFIFVPTAEVTKVYDCLGKWARSLSKNKKIDGNTNNEPLKIVVGKRQGHVISIDL